MPRADDMPPLEIHHLDFPSPINELGIKGVGESGVVSPAAVIANAVEDALWDRGVRVTRVPLTPARIFELLRAGARSSGIVHGQGRGAPSPDHTESRARCAVSWRHEIFVFRLRESPQKIRVLGRAPRLPASLRHGPATLCPDPRICLMVNQRWGAPDPFLCADRGETPQSRGAIATPHARESVWSRGVPRPPRAGSGAAGL